MRLEAHQIEAALLAVLFVLLFYELRHEPLEPAHRMDAREGIDIGRLEKLLRRFLADAQDMEGDARDGQRQGEGYRDGGQRVFVNIGAPAPMGVDFRHVPVADGLDLRPVEIADGLVEDAQQQGIDIFADRHHEPLGRNALSRGVKVRVFPGVQRFMDGSVLREEEVCLAVRHGVVAFGEGVAPYDLLRRVMRPHIGADEHMALRAGDPRRFGQALVPAPDGDILGNEIGRREVRAELAGPVEVLVKEGHDVDLAVEEALQEPLVGLFLYHFEADAKMLAHEGEDVRDDALRHIYVEIDDGRLVARKAHADHGMAAQVFAFLAVQDERAARIVGSAPRPEIQIDGQRPFDALLDPFADGLVPVTHDQIDIRREEDALDGDRLVGLEVADEIGVHQSVPKVEVKLLHVVVRDHLEAAEIVFLRLRPIEVHQRAIDRRVVADPQPACGRRAVIGMGEIHGCRGDDAVHHVKGFRIARRPRDDTGQHVDQARLQRGVRLLRRQRHIFGPIAHIGHGRLQILVDGAGIIPRLVPGEIDGRIEIADPKRLKLGATQRGLRPKREQAEEQDAKQPGHGEAPLPNKR